VIETADPPNLFGSVPALCRGERVCETQENPAFYIGVLHELGNVDGVAQVWQAHVGSGGLAAGNVLRRLAAKQAWGVGETELDFAAARRGDVSADDLGRLGFGSLKAILSRGCLVVESEDALYEFIAGLVERDEVFADLWECVLAEFLGDAAIQGFAKQCKRLL